MVENVILYLEEEIFFSRIIWPHQFFRKWSLVFCIEKVGFIFWKQHGVKWYRKFFDSDALQNMTIERVNFTENFRRALHDLIIKHSSSAAREQRWILSIIEPPRFAFPTNPWNMTVKCMQSTNLTPWCSSSRLRRKLFTYNRKHFSSVIWSNLVLQNMKASCSTQEMKPSCFV